MPNVDLWKFAYVHVRFWEMHEPEPFHTAFDSWCWPGARCLIEVLFPKCCNKKLYFTVCFVMAWASYRPGSQGFCPCYHQSPQTSLFMFGVSSLVYLWCILMVCEENLTQGCWCCWEDSYMKFNSTYLYFIGPFISLIYLLLVLPCFVWFLPLRIQNFNLWLI